MKKILIFLMYLLQLLIVHQASAKDTEKPFFDQFKSCVVLIEKIETLKTDGTSKLTPFGTGFWVKGKNDELYLVSNKHIFNNRNQIVLRVTQQNGPSSALLLIELKNKKGKPNWVGHPDSKTDIAAILVDKYLLLNNVQPKIIKIPTSLFSTQSQIIEGDDVFFIGFPLGIRTTENSFPLLRTGAISLKPTEDFLKTASGITLGKNIYLLDAYSTGGSSGSPVFLKPGVSRPFLKANTFATTKTEFIGIVSGHVPDLQRVYTTSDKGVAESNAYLTIVHPSEKVLETINLLK